MNIINKMERILEEENILPVSEETWFTFQLLHSQPDNEAMKLEQFKYIKEQVGNKAGIYIYIKDKNVIYIGKAKVLNIRIKSHYVESFSTVPGDSKTNRWHRFFMQNQGDVKILWKEIDKEEDRQIVEMILTNKYKPTFLSFR